LDDESAPDLESELDVELAKFEKEKQMPYVSGFERRAEERGHNQGRLEGHQEALLRILERRYQVPIPQELATRIRDCKKAEELDRWLDAAFEANTLDELCRRLAVDPRHSSTNPRE
jgi:predicted transposase YdaD